MYEYPPNCLGPPALGDVVKFLSGQSFHMGQGIASAFNTKTLEFYPLWGGPFQRCGRIILVRAEGVTVGLAGTRAQESGPVVGFSTL